ncbi:hypothetical protein SAMN05428947_10622 [Mucilaginibacter sp. OK283]|nr:hypothetical protein SAMN05428947_10622 [Mucilaginibacter sp. OK283]
MKTTHPDIATLVTPLSASRIEGLKPEFFYYPLCNEVGERVDRRSLVGVSLTAMSNLTKHS